MREYRNAETAARAYGARVGITGRSSGHLYTSTGNHVCHGWASLVGILVRSGVIVDLDGLSMDVRTGYAHNGRIRRNAFDRRPVLLTDRLRQGDAGRAARNLIGLAR